MKTKFRKITFVLICLFVVLSVIACGSPVGGEAGNPSGTTQPVIDTNIKMKEGYKISECFLALGAGEGDEKTLRPSSTAPGAGIHIQPLSKDDSPVAVVAWCDGNTIWYYAAGYTDTDGKKIPLYTFSYLLFQDCSKLTTIDVSKFDTSNAQYVWGMFDGCASLTEIIGLNTLDFSKADGLSFMFADCKSLTSIDLSGWNTRNVKEMKYMFHGCENLVSISFGNIDTSNVTDMHSMFYKCELLASLDLSSFNTSNVTDMSWMFAYCEALASLDVSSFNTSKVTDMYGMFEYCKSLTSLDISNFDISNVTKTAYMFSYCDNLETIYVEPGTDWGLLDFESDSFVFFYSTKLRGGAGTEYSSSHYGIEYAHVDGGTSNPGYFTAKQ